MSGPRFSIVVPTRDRPDFLRACLSSIATQMFTDFEVIVADNHTGTSARATFDACADDRFRYVTPDAPLEMADNWEFACEQARGEYVAVVIDKTVLHPTALDVAQRALEATPVDIVTWRNEAYRPIDERKSLGPGWYGPAAVPVASVHYDPSDELARRLSMSVRRDQEGERYFRGKICFGAFSSELLARMRALAGRLFFPLAPDYTSFVTAAATHPTALDVGRPLLISFASAVSNGMRQTTDPHFARDFITRSDPTGEIYESLPIPGLHASLHNVVASDYVRMAQRCRDRNLPQLNRQNLAARAREDLERVRWPDGRVRSEQYARLEEFEATLDSSPTDSSSAGATETQGVEPRPSLRRSVTARVMRHPGLERALLRVFGRPSARRYESILEAAAVADVHYARATGRGDQARTIAEVG